MNDNGPWFRYRRARWHRVRWWPCHWKGWLLLLAAIPLALAGFVVAFVLADRGQPLISLLAGAIIACPLQWVGFRHAESADEASRPAFRTFHNDPS
jgi:hypothetical protein